MKLIEIGFEGYKAYNGDDAPLQRLRLAPLTLVFGKNNSGKSAARTPAASASRWNGM
jgi:DNA repair exonuclease SbcCD ATPase subunit